ncbi:EF-hand domain-containing protein [Sphingomonas parva]|nr:EF-hand domain-containing protein [Sphingomonas parva]
MKKLVLAGAALAVLASTGAAAQPQSRAAGQSLTRDAVAARVDARFARLDANRDGAVTQDELRARAEARRGKRGELRNERRAQRGERRAEAFARLDANGDGSISRAEFDARPKLDREQRLERRAARGERRSFTGHRGHRGGALFARLGARHFQAADANRDGRLTRAEARQSALALFDRIDADRDGTISQDERRAAREAFGGQRGQRPRA